MNLNKLAREFYAPTIITEPPVAAWSASFDDGATWVEGELVSDQHRWLVAGPAADPGTATVVPATVTPLLRAVDNPEIIVRDAPRIYVGE